MQTALRHCKNGRPAAALARLLELWPKARGVALAEVIEVLGVHLDRGVEKLPNTRQHAHWMDRFSNRQPADVTLLVREAVAGTSKECKLRIDALVELKADPRSTLPLLDFMKTCEGIGVWGKVWTASFKVLAHVADPRVPQLLRKLREQLAESDVRARFPAHEGQIARIDKFLEKFPESSAPMEVSEIRQAVEALAAGEPPDKDVLYLERGDLGADIHEQIFENVHDNGPLQVWSDILMEQGDELGEFVALQLKASRGPLTKAQLATEKRLAKRHLNRLLGPLAPVVDPGSAVFRRGLLYAAKAVFRTPEHEAELGSLPEWRSVFQVHTSAKHLKSGALPNARRFGVRLIPTDAIHHRSPHGFERRSIAPPGFGHLLELARSRAPLALEAVCVAFPKTPVTPEQAAKLDAAPGLPELRELHFVQTVNPYRRPAATAVSFASMLGGTLLRRIPRLVFEGAGPRRIAEFYKTFRPDGGELILCGDGLWSWTVRSDDAGLHLLGSAHEGSAVKEVEKSAPGDWASVDLRAPSMPRSLLARLEKVFGKDDSVTLPKLKR